MQIIDDKLLLINTRNPDRVLNAVKKSKIVGQTGDVSQVAVYWGYDEAKQLSKLKFKDVPSTIKRDYKWSGKLQPFTHQKETSSFLTMNQKAFCFSEQGTGKTASVIWAADYLLNIGKIKRVLVICPLSIMKPAWQQDLFKFAMHRSCGVAHGNASARRKVIKSDCEFVIINYDGVEVVKDEIAEGGFDLVVVDEANAYKHPGTKRWKVLRSLVDNDTWLWMLTGTPAAQSPVDAYGLAKLVNPENTPRYFGQFRDMVMYKLSAFKWIAKPKAQTIVHMVLQPAIRYERSQCLDLPPVTYLEREAPLTAQQMAIYKKLKQDMYVEAAGEDISAVNAAVKINKLLQVSGGSVYSDTGEVIDLDVSNRLKIVQEVIDEASHKVLVFVPFTHTIELLKEYLEKNNITCDVINGQVAVNRRSDIVKRFQTEADPKVLIIQPQAAAHGLTLTAANTIVWYSPITSVETYLQANARINRPGQLNPMAIVHIKGSDVETRLYSMLRSNIGTHTKIIDLYRQTLTEGT
jgi:SNF2 family DNA or RNA helicase